MVSVNFSNIVNYINVYNSSSYYQTYDTFKWSQIPIYPNCQELDLEEILMEVKPTLQISFFFHTDRNVRFSIIPQERNKILRKRRLKSNLISYSGPQIEIKDILKSPKVYDATLSLSQSISSERDSESNCALYPNENFDSYRDCDEYYVHKEFLKYDKRLMPFWATDDLSEVTSKRLALHSNKSNHSMIDVKYIINFPVLGTIKGTNGWKCT